MQKYFRARGKKAVATETAGDFFDLGKVSFFIPARVKYAGPLGGKNKQVVPRSLLQGI